MAELLLNWFRELFCKYNILLTNLATELKVRIISHVSPTQYLNFVFPVILKTGLKGKYLDSMRKFAETSFSPARELKYKADQKLTLRQGENKPTWLALSRGSF